LDFKRSKFFIEYKIPSTTSLTCIKFLLKCGSKSFNFFFLIELKTKLFKTSRPKSALIINEACEKGFFYLEKTSTDMRKKFIKPSIKFVSEFNDYLITLKNLSN